MERHIMGLIKNRATGNDVCSHYLNIPIKEFIADEGKPLKIKFENGCMFTHEIVEELEQTDYGFWITTTRKIWRLDRI